MPKNQGSLFMLLFQPASVCTPPFIVLDGELIGVGTLSGDLFITKFLEGDLNGVGTLTGDLFITHFLEGAINGAGTLSGDLTIVVPLAGDIDGVGTLTGDLDMTRTFAGTPSGVGVLSGDLLMTRAFAGIINGVGTLAGDLFIEHFLAGTISGVGVLSGDLKTDLVLEGDLVGVGILSGDIDMTRAFTGALAGVGVLSGNLTIIVPGPKKTEQILTADGQPVPTTSAGHDPFAQWFEIPALFTVNDSIELFELGPWRQIVSLAIVHDALGTGSSGLMNIGVKGDASAFIANADILVAGVDLMTVGSANARASGNLLRIIATFTGDVTFTPGTRLRLVGQTVGGSLLPA